MIFDKEIKFWEIGTIDEYNKIFKNVENINPTNVAFTYTLTPVYKRKQISDFSKIQLALAREYAVSVKMLHHDFDEYIKNNDISELTYQEKLQELNERLKLEKQYYEAINNNPDEYMHNKLKIATQPILHGQIRYYYINEEGEKEDMQRHLSSEIPNILVFDENSGFTKRKDNKIDAFLENSIRVFGNVYMRKNWFLMNNGYRPTKGFFFQPYLN